MIFAAANAVKTITGNFPEYGLSFRPGFIDLLKQTLDFFGSFIFSGHISCPPPFEFRKDNCCVVFQKQDLLRSLSDDLSHSLDIVRIGAAATADEVGAVFDHLGDISHIILKPLGRDDLPRFRDGRLPGIGLGDERQEPATGVFPVPPFPVIAIFIGERLFMRNPEPQ